MGDASESVALRTGSMTMPGKSKTARSVFSSTLASQFGQNFRKRVKKGIQQSLYESDVLTTTVNEGGI
jgi:hypothetical protein